MTNRCLRKRCVASTSSMALLLVWLLVGVTTAAAQTPPSAQIPSSLAWDDFAADISLRLRSEAVDWLEPRSSETDESYLFSHSKLQLGLKYSTPGFRAYVQGQYFQLYDLPNDGVGLGATYYLANDRQRHPGEVTLRQSYVNLVEGSASVIVGRFLYSNGMEGLSSDETVKMLRQKRISERVLGPFDFTGGRSFDGARIGWHQEGVGALDISAFRPTWGGFALDLNRQIEEILVTTTAFSLSPKLVGNADVQFFHYYYEDERHGRVLKVDNRPADIRAADFDDISINNFGFHAIHTWQSDEMEFDALIWLIAQNGKWGELDHRAAANAIETGVQFKEIAGSPRLRLGWNWSTGDADANDEKHTTFFQMLPTPRQYAETPFFNLMNTQELFTNLTAQVWEGLSLKASGSYLWTAQKNDLLYAGGGASTDDQFGYSGTPLGESRKIGALAGFQAAYTLSAHLMLSMYYGHLFGSSALDAAFHSKNLDYGFVEAVMKF